MKYTTVANHFWKWFKQHNSIYLNLLKFTASKTALEYQFNELLIHLRAYCKWIEADIMPGKNPQEATLIITTGGRPKGFKRAEQLVAKAPAIPNWTIIALRPPRPLGEFVELRSKPVDITLDNCWFRYMYKDNKERIVIGLYVDWILPGKESAVMEHVFLYVENLLGERSKALNVYIKNIEPRCDAPAKATLHKLEELPEYIGRLKSKISIDSKGRMEGW